MFLDKILGSNCEGAVNVEQAGIVQFPRFPTPTTAAFCARYYDSVPEIRSSSVG